MPSGRNTTILQTVSFITLWIPAVLAPFATVTRQHFAWGWAPLRLTGPAIQTVGVDDPTDCSINFGHKQQIGVGSLCDDFSLAQRQPLQIDKKLLDPKFTGTSPHVVEHCTLLRLRRQTQLVTGDFYPWAGTSIWGLGSHTQLTGLLVSASSPTIQLSFDSVANNFLLSFVVTTWYIDRTGVGFLNSLFSLALFALQFGFQFGVGSLPHFSLAFIFDIARADFLHFGAYNRGVGFHPQLTGSLSFQHAASPGDCAVNSTESHLQDHTATTWIFSLTGVGSLWIQISLALLNWWIDFFGVGSHSIFSLAYYSSTRTALQNIGAGNWGLGFLSSLTGPPDTDRETEFSGIDRFTDRTPTESNWKNIPDRHWHIPLWHRRLGFGRFLVNLQTEVRFLAHLLTLQLEIKSADDPEQNFPFGSSLIEGHTLLLNALSDFNKIFLWLCFTIQLSPHRLHQLEPVLNTVAQSPTVLCCTRLLWEPTVDQTCFSHPQWHLFGDTGHFSNRSFAAITQFLCLAAFIGCLSVLLQRFTFSFWLNERVRKTLSATTDLEHTGGQPGPKSRHKLPWNHRFSWIWLVWFLLSFSFTAVELVRSEGYTLVMEGVEVSHDWVPTFLQQCDTKQHDTRPETCLRAKDWRAVPKPVVKRSIKRAYVRAVKHGVAWYKGRCLTPTAFPKALQQHQPDHALPERDKPSPQLTSCNRKHQDAKRFRLLQWNAGGLSTHRLDSIKVWMQENHIDATVIAETRWTYENEWSDGDFHYIHTGDPKNRGAGILCVLSTRFCTADSLRWRVIIPGRLIHLQIQLPTRSIDLVGCYQHTQAHNSQREQDRTRWWNQLDALLQGLAARNVLVVTGDFSWGAL